MAGRKKTSEARTVAAPATLFAGLEEHAVRHQLLGEVHARPFPLMPTPRRVLHYAFLVEEDGARDDRAQIGKLLRAQGQEAPKEAKYVSIDFGKVRLRWEQHTEFTTYTFDTGVSAEDAFGHKSFADVLPDFSLRAPGKLLVAVEIALVKQTLSDDLFRAHFDQLKLSMSKVQDGAALIGTDFAADVTGATRFLVVNRDLDDLAAGALLQRLLEIETYRVFALLTLPEVQRLTPLITQIERQLSDITTSMRETSGLDANRLLLNKLTTLAGELEAHSAATTYRFGATHAYHTIFEQRLAALEERRHDAHSTLHGFLMRRMNPAMRTVYAFEARMRDLSEKLSRTANLLRTRVDIELEAQNRNLLESMNRRARLQLRLQQTVEGLSVAAVSYYVVGLISYLAKGTKALGLELPAGVVEAVAVPVVVAIIWLVVRQIRRGHSGG